MCVGERGVLGGCPPAPLEVPPNLHLKHVLGPPCSGASGARLKCRFGEGSSWAVCVHVWVSGVCWVGAPQLPWRFNRICISGVFWVLLSVAQPKRRRHANSVGTMACERGSKNNHKKVGDCEQICTLLGTPLSYPFCFVSPTLPPPSLASVSTEFASQACFGSAL